MRQSMLGIYVAAVVALAAGLTAWFANGYPLADGSAWIGVLMWTLAVGPRTVAFPRQRVQITLSDCFVFYGILVHGPLGGITAAFVGTLGALQFGSRKPGPTQAAFNLGAVPLAAALAAGVFEWMDRSASLPARVVAAAAVFALANTLLVAGALALEDNRGHGRAFSFPALAFIGSVFATATAGSLLAWLFPGSYAVAGVVVVGFLAGKVLTSLRERSEKPTGSAAPSMPQPAGQAG